MADDPAKHAIDVVAHRIVAMGHHEYDAWSIYPDIGEFDWLVVQAKVEKIANGLRPTEDAFDAAYEFLASRADTERAS